VADDLNTFGAPAPADWTPPEAFEGKAYEAVSDSTCQVSPIMVLQIAWIIFQLVMKLYQCHKGNATAAAERVQRLSLLDKIRLGIMIRRCRYQGSPALLVEQLRQLGGRTTPEELRRLWEAGQ
jgi:hypothetical protein